MLLLLAALGSLSAAGPAEEPSPAAKLKAKARIKKARAFYGDGQYDQAISEYRAAYKLMPVAEVLFNIGQIERVKGDKPAAVTSYRAYLAEAPEGRMSAEAKTQIASLTREQVPDALGDRWDKLKRSLADVPADKRAPLDEKWSAIEGRVGGGEVESLAADLDGFDQALAAVLHPAPVITPESQHRAVAKVARTPRAPFVPNPIIKKWWFWTAVGGGVVVVLAIGLGAGLSGASDPVPTLGTLQ